jgi:tryptophanyl-tRNA synthetase
MPFTPRVFSGIQPSGELHLGNYLGAIKRLVGVFLVWRVLLWVVVLEGWRVWLVREWVGLGWGVVGAGYVAAGVDPRVHIVFNQSRVVQHAELAWIFNCVARMGWMSRMTQWKDKTAGKNAEAESLGLFAYPTLMAADLLLYKATHVPVGEDQKQHLELTRDIAQKFNNDFGPSIREQGLQADYFPLTEPVITGPATRVMSLRDGKKKMSKSDPSDQARILMMDEPDAIAKKLKRATTDPEPLPSEEKGLEGRPEADNLVGIYAALADRNKADVLREFGGGQFSGFKNALVELCVAKLAPIASEMKRLVADPGHVDSVLVDGADRARVLADETMRKTMDIVGFIRKR